MGWFEVSKAAAVALTMTLFWPLYNEWRLAGVVAGGCADVAAPPGQTETPT